MALILGIGLAIPTAHIGAVVDIETSTIIDVGNGTNSTTTSSSSVNASDAELYGGVNSYDSSGEAVLEVNSEGVAITASTQVNSYADLQVFSENMIIRNSNVANVVVSSDVDEESKVVVVYKHRGKLFGFIPVTIKSVTSVEAEVDNTINVNSGLSWWSFLVAQENYSKAELESQIENNSTVQTNMKVDASASAKARVAEAVISEIRVSASSVVAAS